MLARRAGCAADGARVMRPIVVLGGYGRLGRACVLELAAQTHAPLRIAGRNAQRAESLALSLGERAAPCYADAADPRILARALEGASAVIACCGGDLRTALQCALELRVPFVGLSPLPLDTRGKAHVGELAWRAQVPVVLHAGAVPGFPESWPSHWCDGCPRSRSSGSPRPAPSPRPRPRAATSALRPKPPRSRERAACPSAGASPTRSALAHWRRRPARISRASPSRTASERSSTSSRRPAGSRAASRSSSHPGGRRLRGGGARDTRRRRGGRRSGAECADLIAVAAALAAALVRPSSSAACPPGCRPRATRSAPRPR